MRIGLAALVASTLLPVAALAQGGVLPDRGYRAEQVGRIISPQLGAEDHNQPSVVDGYLMLAGNASHSLWDIADPFRPREVARFQGPHGDGDAESHMVAFARRPDGQLLAATISGRGVDLWDLTEIARPTLLSSVVLDGIEYGDNSHAVWGVALQGDRLYAGGTNTGLHVVDVTEPSSPRVVARVPTSEFGGVSAGTVFALGNLLVVATPKNQAGLATLDISDPDRPRPLDFVRPESDSYIGWFYGPHAYLLTPLRVYDVTTDPAAIRLLASLDTPATEYASFGDDRMYLGALRPRPGVHRVDVTDPTAPSLLDRIEGRVAALPLNDDQFSLPIGNLLVMSDDEIDIGSVIAVLDARRDATPPRVLHVEPRDGSSRQPTTTRIGVSLSDQIDLRSVDASTFVVRPLGGEPLDGTYSHMQTLVGFWPSAPLSPDTTYEVVLPAGGVTDLAGNPLAIAHRSVFSTGDDVAALECRIRRPDPIVVGATARLSADAVGEGATYAWELADGATAAGAEPSVEHRYEAPGRYPVRLTVARDGLLVRCAATQIVHRPAAAFTPTTAGTLALAGGRVLVVDGDSGAVAILDAGTLSRIAEVDLGAEPRALAVGPGGRVWVTVRRPAGIAIVDPASGEVVRVELPYGSAPHGVVLDADRAYVALEATGRVLALDAVRGEVVDEVDAGSRPRGLALAGDRLFVTRFVSPATHGEVVELSTRPLRRTRTIALAEDPGPDTDRSGRGVPNYLSSIVVSPDGTEAAIPSKKDNTSRGPTRDGLPLTTDNTVRAIVSRLDLAAGEEAPSRRVDLDDHDLPVAAAYSPRGDLLFVVSQGTNQVDVLDAYDGSLVAGLPTGPAPQGLAITADGRLFVHAALSRSVSVYDVSGLLDGSDTVGPLIAEARAIAAEPLPDAVLRGKVIFHDADSRQMSQDGYVSCATCHLEGDQDGRVWDFTDRGEGLRNTISMLGRAGTAHGPVHWTGNFDEIQDFENDIRAHFGGSGLMSDEDFDATRDPLGERKAGRSDDLDALAAYVATLTEFPPSPHRGPGGAHTDDAVAGRAVFDRLRCARCHAGEATTDSARGVLHDVGTWTPASGRRRGVELQGFDTPTLRGVWATAPYFHDGSAATLDEVLDRHAPALERQDRRRLLAFLRQLEGEPLGLDAPPIPACDAGDCAPPPPRPSGGGCAAAPHAAPRTSPLALLAAAFALRSRRRGGRGRAGLRDDRGRGDGGPGVPARRARPAAPP